MKKEDIMACIDHTMLKPVATMEQIEKLCEEAIKYHTASICIPSCYVKSVKEKYGNQINICTVVGFPLGYCNTQTKITETKQAILDGASEIDMVINLCDVKNGDFQKVEDEICALKKCCGEKILKVIIETCYLTKEEKIEMCKVVTKAGADYIKTSTGFGDDGATMEDILLFKEYIGEHVKIKAAGGIKSVRDMEEFLEAGCSRLGTSSGIALLKGRSAGGY
ncbi:MAG: deoxyribose-phosphate aldolase [Lachnospiraceae bacterium]|nr:deoxyribose-phosphate aldolase [Lachnospiraceae bacterium]